MAEGSPEGGQREAKGAPKRTNGVQRMPKGTQRTFKGSPWTSNKDKMYLETAQGHPKVLQRHQREAKRERYIAGVMIIRM